MRSRSLLLSLTLITVCLEGWSESRATSPGEEPATRENALTVLPKSTPSDMALTALETAKSSSASSLTFNNVKYIHRWSKNGQHEFTPPGQEDLAKWSDMLTINIYDRVVDGEGLAMMANKTLENYQRAKGLVLKTRSVPRTTDKPAEHLIVAVFRQPSFFEVSQARFKMVDQKGVAIIHCHRVYGDKAATEMGEWLKQDGLTMETTLMDWEFAITAPTDLHKVENR